MREDLSFATQENGNRITISFRLANSSRGHVTSLDIPFLIVGLFDCMAVATRWRKHARAGAKPWIVRRKTTKTNPTNSSRAQLWNPQYLLQAEAILSRSNGQTLHSETWASQSTACRGSTGYDRLVKHCIFFVAFVQSNSSHDQLHRLMNCLLIAFPPFSFVTMHRSLFKSRPRDVLVLNRNITCL